MRLTLLVASMMCTCGAAIVTAAGPSRIALPLDDKWRFHLGDVAGAERADFNDAAWSVVTLPHTWNSRDGQDGGGDYHRGVGWYRRRFGLSGIQSIPSEDGEPAQFDRRVFVRFRGANSVAEVFLNGRSLGVHQGGYSAFCFELTPHLQPGRSQMLAVRVDNTHRDDVPPWSADFTFFGGLYRGVELLMTPRLCVSPLDYASPGVYITPQLQPDGPARVQVRTMVSNGHREERTVELHVKIGGPGGVTAAEHRAPCKVGAGATESCSLELTIREPRLWNGRQDPYLYTTAVWLRDGQRAVDMVTQPMGVRAIAVDPQRGFMLNGKPLDLYGVNRHQDRVDLGWAVSREHHEQDFAFIRELGCNAVRLAHYQHDDYVYTLADQAGLIVWAEIPLVNRITDTPEFAANCRQQLIELIRQNYNHPSICMWGVHNEITASWVPGPDPGAVVKELAAVAQREDPTRPSVCAGTDPMEHPANWETDLTAFNRYFGWYGGGPDGIGPWADALHAKHPQRCIGLAEYGAGANPAHHEWPPKQPKPDGLWHPEEWQTHYHERHWLALRERPFVWCKLVWNMFDFASDGRAEGGTPGMNDKGLVTYDRTLRKDAFYWYKMHWSGSPVLHITSRRFTPRTTATTPVRVYSNCQSVELHINGRPLGTREGTDGIHVWEDVPLKLGANDIEARAQCNGKPTTDQCQWTRVEPSPAE